MYFFLILLKDIETGIFYFYRKKELINMN